MVLPSSKLEELPRSVGSPHSAIIRTQASSLGQVEVGEKKDRYDDSLCATRAAVELGIVPGGGVALLKASQILKDVPFANFDQSLGIALIRQAITKPIRIIVENAGEEGSVIVGNILDKYADKFEWGYDAGRGEYINMVEAGIVSLPLNFVCWLLIDVVVCDRLIRSR